MRQRVCETNSCVFSSHRILDEIIRGFIQQTTWSIVWWDYSYDMEHWCNRQLSILLQSSLSTHVFWLLWEKRIMILTFFFPPQFLPQLLMGSPLTDIQRNHLLQVARSQTDLPTFSSSIGDFVNDFLYFVSSWKKSCVNNNKNRAKEERKNYYCTFFFFWLSKWSVPRFITVVAVAVAVVTTSHDHTTSTSNLPKFLRNLAAYRLHSMSKLRQSVHPNMQSNRNASGSSNWCHYEAKPIEIRFHSD
jgi:hypothetical protein